MAYVALFILLFCILYSPELFLIVFGLFVAGWVGYTMGKENKEVNLSKKVIIEPIELDPDELKSAAEKYYEREVERSLKPEYRIKHIIEREKERLNKVVDKYMRSLKKEEKDGNS